jgi:hypothetical protein
VKKFLFAVLLLILILVSFLNIKQSFWIKEGEMQESALKEPPEGKVGESEKQDYQTPDIYEVSSLKIDSKLPGLKVISAADTMFTDSTIVEMAVEVPKNINGADIFLFNNGKKKDMFYQVKTGIYRFKNVFLDDTINNLIFLYRLGNRRSLPVKIVIIKESGR